MSQEERKDAPSRPERSGERERRSRSSSRRPRRRMGAMGALLYVVLVIGVSALLAGIGWLMAGDVLALISDGIVYAGVGQALNFGWNWDNVSSWLARATLKENSAPRLAASLSQAVS